MIKILYIISDKNFGGGSRHVFELINNIDEKKFKPVLISIPSPILDRVSDKIKKYNVEMNSRIDIGAVKKIQEIIEIEKPDIIHLHSTRACLIGTFAVKKYNLPVIYTEHLFAEDYIPINKLIHISQIFALKKLSRYITKVIAVSGAVKKYLVDNKIFPADKIEVIYHGIKISDFPKARPQRHKELVKICTVGTIKRIKGYQYLMQALSIVKSKYQFSNFQLELVGPGTDQKEIKELALKFNLAVNIKFLGTVQDVKSLLHSWDIYIQPSLSESFGLAVAEAMSKGLPVITTRVGGLKELVTEKTGIFVEPKNAEMLASAIIKLISDKDLRNKMGKNARERIKKYFSLTQMIKQTEKLYLSLIK